MSNYHLSIILTNEIIRYDQYPITIQSATLSGQFWALFGLILILPFSLISFPKTGIPFLVLDMS